MAAEAAEAAEKLIPLTLPEVRRLLWRLVWRAPSPTSEVIGWSRWRRRHQAQAKHWHYRRREVEHLQL
jgi:hypothetical protein